MRYQSLSLACLTLFACASAARKISSKRQTHALLSWRLTLNQLPRNENRDNGIIDKVLTTARALGTIKVVTRWTARPPRDRVETQMELTTHLPKDLLGVQLEIMTHLPKDPLEAQMEIPTRPLKALLLYKYPYEQYRKCHRPIREYQEGLWCLGRLCRPSRQSHGDGLQLGLRLVCPFL